MNKQILVGIFIGVLITGSVVYAYRMGASQDTESRSPVVGEESESTPVSDTEVATPTTGASAVPTPSVARGSSLDLSGRNLTKVPEDTFSRTELTILNLSNNNLSGALPGEIRHLTKLRVLDLSNNNFTGVPAEIGQLGQLETLNLSGNPISGLPQELGNLSHLQVLDVRGTQYSAQDLEGIKKGLPKTVTIYQ